MHKLAYTAEAAAVRPQTTGAALHTVSQGREIAGAMLQTLETQNVIAGQADIPLVPKNSALVVDLFAAQENPIRQKAALLGQATADYMRQELQVQELAQPPYFLARCLQ